MIQSDVRSPPLVSPGMGREERNDLHVLQKVGVALASADADRSPTRLREQSVGDRGGSYAMTDSRFPSRTFQPLILAQPKRGGRHGRRQHLIFSLTFHSNSSYLKYQVAVIVSKRKGIKRTELSIYIQKNSFLSLRKVII